MRGKARAPCARGRTAVPGQYPLCLVSATGGPFWLCLGEHQGAVAVPEMEREWYRLLLLDCGSLLWSGCQYFWTHSVIKMFKCLAHRTVTSSNQDLKGPDFLVRSNLYLFFLWQDCSVSLWKKRNLILQTQGLKVSPTLALQIWAGNAATSPSSSSLWIQPWAWGPLRGLCLANLGEGRTDFPLSPH